MAECVFCRIVAGELPCWLVDEDDATLAFLDRAPATPGHTLVVPKRHARDIFELHEDDAAAVMRAVHRVARRLADRLAPPGLSVVQANGEAAGQEVRHFHVHLVPRYGEDALPPPWRAAPAAAEETLDAVRDRLVGRAPGDDARRGV